MAQTQLEFDFDACAAAKHSAVLSPDEIYANASQELLEKLAEDSRIERKPPGIHREKLARYFSMWGNSPPYGGLIVIGIGDEGAILGCSELDAKQLNRIEAAGHELVPDARYSVKRIAAGGVQRRDDFLLLLRVHYREDRVVETTSGEAYIRRGESCCKLTDEEKRELAIDKGQVDHEQEPCGLHYPNDFDMEAVRHFVASVARAKQLRTTHTPEQILANRRLGKNVGSAFVPNTACALLFANNPQAVVPGCVIRVQRYEGTQKLTGKDRNVVKDEIIEGRVPELIVRAESVIDSQLRTFSSLGNDGKFYTQPEYPHDAWYEAIVNACVHRSYSLRKMTIFVRIFDDRLVIESPGPFPPLVTPENIYDVHHRRNYFLMDAMFYLDFVKCENEGTRRMRDCMLEMQLPEPQFEQKEVGNALVRVTLRNLHNKRRMWIDKDASHLVGESVFAALSVDEKRCINFAAEHGAINVSEAQRLVGLKTWHAARSLLRELEKRGIFEYTSKFHRDPNACFCLLAKREGDT